MVVLALEEEGATQLVEAKVEELVEGVGAVVVEEGSG